MPTRARGSYAVCQPAISSRQVRSMSSVAIRAVVAADGDHPIAAEQPEHSGDDADPAGE